MNSNFKGVMMHKNYIKFLAFSIVILGGKTLNISNCYCMEDLPVNYDGKLFDNYNLSNNITNSNNNTYNHSNTNNNNNQDKLNNINSLQQSSNNKENKNSTNNTAVLNIDNNGLIINTSSKNNQRTILNNNIDKIDLQNNQLLQDTNKKIDNVLNLLHEVEAPYYAEIYATQLGNLKNIYTNFSNAINTFIKYINNNPECNIFIKKEEYKQYFNNNIINNNEIIDVVDLCKLLVTNTIEKSKAIADNIINEIKMKSLRELMCANYLQKYITKQLNLFNNDFSKIIQCLEQCISPKIKDVDVTAFNELNSLLTPVISELYKLESKVYISNFMQEYDDDYYNKELLSDFIYLKCNNLNLQDKKRFAYWQKRLFNMFVGSNNFVMLLDMLCYQIEFGTEYPRRLEEIEEKLEKGEIDSNTAKQMIEEANKAYKDAQHATVALNNIKYQLYDGDDIMHLRLPYEEDVIELPQLLRNFAVIIINHIKLVYKNINEITNKYKNIKHEKLQDFEKEIIYNFALLARPLKIIKNYSFGNLYSAISRSYPNVCKKIINKAMWETFKCIDNIKDWEYYKDNNIKLPKYLLNNN